MKETNAKAAASNANANNISSNNNAVTYPMGRGDELKEKLTHNCYSGMSYNWWINDVWECEFFIADTLGGAWSAVINLGTNGTFTACIMDPDQNCIAEETFQLDAYDSPKDAFEELCGWVDSQMDRI